MQLRYNFLLVGMSAERKILYEFGPFRVDPDRQLLLRADQPVALTPKAFETLLILIRHDREVVSKDDLMKELWPDAFVEEANLTQSIFMLRKALGDTPEARRYVVTIPGRGYKFATEVRTVAPDGDVVIASHTRSQFVVEQSRGTEVGPALPDKRRHRISRKYVALIATLTALAVIGAVAFVHRHRPVALGEGDSVLVAEFTNATGDPVFDDTLRQGLIVQLEQSPFLKLVSEDRIRQTLQLMGQPLSARLDSGVARQVCERTGSAALLQGSIASLGSQYVLGLRATNCRTGDLLDEEQVQAAKKEEVLGALSQIASKFRNRIGESLATIKEHDIPLAEATTPSLDALKAYSMGWRKLSGAGDIAALPFFQRAIQFDPKFAMAYAFLGRIYGDMGEGALSAENTSKAYELRDRASDHEKFWITAAYDTQVRENLDQAQQVCGVWAETYRRDPIPHSFQAGLIYPVLAKYQQAVTEATRAKELDPDFAIVYFLLANRYQELGDLNRASQTLQQAERRKLELPEFLLEKYDIAFLRGDSEEMAHIAQLARSDRSADEWVTQHEASALAYSGHVREARKTAERAEDLALQAGHLESEGLYRASVALWEGFFGDSAAAKEQAKTALAISNDRGVEYGAALALALGGDLAHSQQLADDLEHRFPEDTSVQFSYLPVLRARLALSRGEPATAIDVLQKAMPFELGSPRSALHGNFGALYPIYLRGEAYLDLRQGADAAGEFQRILDHRGVVVSDPIGALAHLQSGRAYAVQGDTAKARSAFQDFLTLWEHADPDIPVLKEAEAEFQKLR